jgi:hypothetical protein
MTTAHKYKSILRGTITKAKQRASLCISLLIGLICGIVSPFLSARVSAIFMMTGLALLGAAFLFYLINRHVFKDEHAGERGF